MMQVTYRVWEITEDTVPDSIIGYGAGLHPEDFFVALGTALMGNVTNAYAFSVERDEETLYEGVVATFDGGSVFYGVLIFGSECGQTIISHFGKVGEPPQSTNAKSAVVLALAALEQGDEDARLLAKALYLAGAVAS